MNLTNVLNCTILTLCGGMTLLVSASSAMAQGGGPGLPMVIGNYEAIVDEFGVVLEGDALSPTGDRVEILRQTGTNATPPNADGTPGAETVIISQGVTRIGNLTSPDLTNSGLFAVSIPTNQPLPGTKLFVRAFNADTTSGASFYGDSSVFTVDAKRNVYLIQIHCTINPLDTGDSDDDGLNNSYEKSYGSNAHNPDTDGDGVNDLYEHLSGTDLLDAGRYLRIESEVPASETDLAVTWQSVPGRCYQVEYTLDDLALDPVYLPVGDPVKAHADFHTLIDVNGLVGPTRFYRVWALDISITCDD